MESYAHDNTPLHASLRRSPLANEFPPFAIFGLLEGVVLKAKFKDDAENVSKTWTEYDVLEVSTRQIYLRARLGSLLGGINNFEENVLAETTGTVDGAPLVIEDASATRGLALEPDPSAGITPTESYNLNGERVVFGCLGGVYTGAFIVATLPHPQSSFSSLRGEAPRHRFRINGWINLIDNSKNLKIKHDDGRELSLNSDGSIVLRTKDNHHFQIGTDGSIEIVQKGGTNLRLGSSTASATALRGESTNANISAVMTALVALGTAISTWMSAALPVVANPLANPAFILALTTTLQAAQASLNASLPGALSTTVKVP